MEGGRSSGWCRIGLLLEHKSAKVLTIRGTFCTRKEGVHPEIGYQEKREARGQVEQHNTAERENRHILSRLTSSITPSIVWWYQNHLLLTKRRLSFSFPFP